VRSSEDISVSTVNTRRKVLCRMSVETAEFVTAYKAD